VSLGLLFAGQGHQHADMLRWLDHRPEAAGTLAALAAQIGPGWRARLADASWAQRNDIAQPLLTALAIAAWQCLAAQLPSPTAVAGYSVGELAAFSVAGVFDAPTALALAAERARLMDRDVAGADTGLLGVSGVNSATLATVCERYGLSLAIRLADDRAVLGGAATAVAAAHAHLLTLGARCTPLAVRIASHTPWVAVAADAFEQHLAGLPFAAPGTAIVCNFSGMVERQVVALRRVLARQIASTVLWDSCMDTLAERRVSCVLEIGPGRALAALWSERHPEIPVRSADEFRSVDAVSRWVRSALR
jgi:[acyl-carrier-protein] S-malonyltransferase